MNWEISSYAASPPEYVIKLFKNKQSDSKKTEKEFRKVTRDPVCRLHINQRTARFWLDDGKHTFYFCSIECMAEFERDPQAYMHRLVGDWEPRIRPGIKS